LMWAVAYCLKFRLQVAKLENDSKSAFIAHVFNLRRPRPFMEWREIFDRFGSSVGGWAHEGR
jgi:hypothetical protein